MILLTIRMRTNAKNRTCVILFNRELIVFDENEEECNYESFMLTDVE